MKKVLLFVTLIAVLLMPAAVSAYDAAPGASVNGVWVEGAKAPAPAAMPLASSLEVTPLATTGFDESSAPCVFVDTGPLGAYAPANATFAGPAAGQGGAILNECGNFGVSGHSSPNFLAFNADCCYATNPETITFNAPVSVFSIKACSGSGAGSTLTITASPGGETTSHTLTTSCVPVSVAGPVINSVRISGPSIFVLDDFSSTECAAEVALPNASDLKALRQFRDEVMASSATGAAYVDLYYQHTYEAAKMLLLDSSLRSQTAKLIKEFMPAIHSMLGQQGQDLVLTSSRMSRVNTLLAAFSAQASPELQAAIADFQAEVAGYEGQTVSNLWAAMSK